MATINGLYIHVTDESLETANELSTHTVERGIDITDTVKRGATVLSLSGLIVDYKDSNFTLANIEGNYDDTMKSYNVISQIKAWQNQGALVTYSGRNICNNMQIKSFNTSHPNTIVGGAKFDMVLQECRFVSNAYVEPKKDTTVKDGGNQQVKTGDNEAVHYTVKKGDKVWNLVATSKSPYYNLKREGAENTPMGRCNWVMKNNPKAFSRANDFGTLKIGAKLLVGYKK